MIRSILQRQKNNKTSFILSKWYADIIDSKTDNVVIFYLGRLNWESIKLSFFNVIEFLDKFHLESNANFNDYKNPFFDENLFIIDHGNIIGKWESLGASLKETLFENEKGYILWECLFPLASAGSNVNGEKYCGLGYVERLTTTIKPWEMPMSNLRWGRFLTQNHHITWIWWIGESSKSLIFYNNKKYTDCAINDDVLRFDNYRLVLKEKFILRNGELGNTVFRQFNWLKDIFTSGILNLHECKWQTKSILYSNDVNIAEGWSIHENVRWGPSIFKTGLGKLFYGFLFTVLLPVVMTLWTRKTESFVNLAIPNFPFIGLIFTTIGALLMIISIFYLWRVGKGLPMNAYPPEKLVTCGPYRYFSHPIYIAATLISYGLSLYYKSKSGFWLTSPLLTLSWFALVHGYENSDLYKRFPNKIIPPLIYLPENLNTNIQLHDFMSCLMILILPRLAIHYLYFIASADKFTNFSQWFYILPLIIFTSTYLKDKAQMRNFILDGFFIVLIESISLFSIPFSYLNNYFIIGTLTLNKINLFFIFQWSWVLLTIFHAFSRLFLLKFIFSIIASFICFNIFTFDFAVAAHLLLSSCLTVFASQRDSLWRFTRSYLQNTANSWSSWRFGKLRIINHSLYAGLSGFVGVYLACGLLQNANIILFVCICMIIGACIMGQITENRSGLSRPFGYFGSLCGTIVGSIIASYYFNMPFIKIAATFALLCPLPQAIGRIRCLIQGCCHGRIANDYIGICVNNPKSRICSLTNLKNKPIHATQFYSIIANLIIGLILWRLWYSNTHLVLIPSLYLILQGLARFVEENFRGEPQTASIKKLKLYQWLSILALIGGIVFVFLPFEHYQLKMSFKLDYLKTATIYAFINAFSYGMDFPESKRRLARLTVD